MARSMGSIDKTAAGRYRVRITTPSGERKPVGTFDTREEAETHLAAIEEAREGVKGHTVASWGAEWLDARELAREIKDIHGTRGIFRKHIETDPLGELGIRNVTRGHVNAWLGRVRKKGARSTAGNALTVLRGLFRSAADHGHSKMDPTVGVKLPREKRTDEPWTWLRPAEQTAFLARIPAPQRYAVQFAIGSGLRAGELVGLELADVTDTTIVVRYGDKNHAPTKNGKLRYVPLFGVAREAWKLWRAALPTWCKKNPKGLAFPGKLGAYRDSSHFFRWEDWDTWTTDVFGKRNVRFHDLRHTCASCLVSGSWGRNWSLEEVQALLGHSSMSITQRYAHLCGTALERAAKDAQSAFLRPLAFLGTQENMNDNTELTTGIEPATAGLQIRRTAEELQEDAEANGHARPRRPFRGGMVLQ